MGKVVNAIVNVCIGIAISGGLMVAGLYKAFVAPGTLSKMLK